MSDLEGRNRERKTYLDARTSRFSRSKVLGVDNVDLFEYARSVAVRGASKRRENVPLRSRPNCVENEGISFHICLTVTTRDGERTMFLRNTVVLTTWLRAEPAASTTAVKFFIACSCKSASRKFHQRLFRSSPPPVTSRGWRRECERGKGDLPFVLRHLMFQLS